MTGTKPTSAWSPTNPQPTIPLAVEPARERERAGGGSEMDVMDGSRSRRWRAAAMVTIAVATSAAIRAGGTLPADHAAPPDAALAPELRLGAGDDEGGEDPHGSKPLAQVTAAVGGSVGATAGSRCVGVDVGKQLVGCRPPTGHEPLTADVESRLAPGI